MKESYCAKIQEIYFVKFLSFSSISSNDVDEYKTSPFVFNKTNAGKT